MSPRTWVLAPSPPDRWIGWFISLVCTLLVVREIARLGDQLGQFTAWWFALAAWVVVLTLILAAFGLVLPLTSLRALWALTAASGLVVQGLSFAAFRGPDPAVHLPIVWGLQPLTSIFFVLLVRTSLAVAAVALSAVLPPASALIWVGTISGYMGLGALVSLSLIALVVLVAGLRERLALVSTSEALGRAAELTAIETEESLRAQRSVARLVHDEVLSTLVAAVRLRGTPHESLRAQAAHALSVLEATAPPDPGAALSTASAAELLASGVRVIAPDTVVSVETVRGEVPFGVVDALRGALAESARNSIRHARAAQRTARISARGDSIEILFADDGLGFDIDALPAERMGVRESILQRVRELDGGTARVESGSGGTRVELGWLR